MTHTPAIEDRFAKWEATAAPADLRRRLAAAIKAIDPVVQLDATGCVLAGVLMEEYHLRMALDLANKAFEVEEARRIYVEQINAELLAALKAFDVHFYHTGQSIMQCWDRVPAEARRDIVAAARTAISRAEGKDQ